MTQDGKAFSLVGEQPREKEAQGRPVGDAQERENEKEQEGECRRIQLRDRFLEPGAGYEQVEAYGRGVVADAEVGQEDHPEVNGIHSKAFGKWNNEGHHDEDGTEDIHHAPDNDEEEIEKDLSGASPS